MKILFTLTALCLICGCGGGEGSPIQYVVPDGYRGLFQISPDPTAPEIPKTDGIYRVVIPTNGFLRVKSMEPFRRWHSHTATFVSGKPLPAGDIYLHYSVTDSEGNSWWLVGTQEEKKISGMTYPGPGVDDKEFLSSLP